jgi:hypothetical protein
MAGEIEPKKDPSTLLELTGKEATKDLMNRPWNLFIIMFTGMGIMSAPAIFGYKGAVADSNFVVGALVVTFAVIAMSELARTLRFIHILFGLWLAAAPFILGYDQEASMWVGIAAGLLLIPLSIPKGKIKDQHGNFDKYIY